MAEITLVAEAGRQTGSRESNRLRATGRIPAVVYGHGGDPLPVSVDARMLRAALSGDAGLNQLLSVQVGGDTHLALARELQRHPVRNTVVHVDFLIVRRDEVVSAEVPLLLVGEARAVEQKSGVIEQPLLTLTVNALPGDIPNAVEVDISNLDIGDMIRIADLVLPPGVTTELDGEEAVVLASGSALSAEVQAEEAAAEDAAASGAEEG
jgi:large subunit ribosomal protein L25